jgi:hypothetical protein
MREPIELIVEMSKVAQEWLDVFIVIRQDDPSKSQLIANSDANNLTLLTNLMNEGGVPIGLILCRFWDEDNGVFEFGNYIFDEYEDNPDVKFFAQNFLGRIQSDMVATARVSGVKVRSSDILPGNA